MRIGELARQAGINASRIRFYEARGILGRPARSANGYRSYGARDLKIIAFIERAQRLGFSLTEIGAFLAAASRTKSNAVALIARLESKLTEIDAHLAEARQRRKEIVKLIRELRAG